MKAYENQKSLSKSRIRNLFAVPKSVTRHHSTNYILVTQIILCAAFFALAVLGKITDQKYFCDSQKFYKAMCEINQSTTPPTDEFHLAGINNLSGAGGEYPAKYPHIPDGYSVKRSIPTITLNLPLSEFYITSEYGWRKHPISRKSDFHTGLDLAAAQGTVVHTCASGIVIKSAYSKSYGNYVRIKHKRGFETQYCHLQYIFVKPGEMIDESTVLGTVGKTGVATGPHLHLELFYNNVGYDPALELPL